MYKCSEVYETIPILHFSPIGKKNVLLIDLSSYSVELKFALDHSATTSEGQA